MLNLVDLIIEKDERKLAEHLEKNDDDEIDPKVEYRKLYDH